MVALQLLNNDSVVGFLVGDFNNINCLIENKYYDKVGNNYPDLKLKQINEFNFDTCSCLKGSFVSFVSTEEMLKFKLPDNYLTKGARLRNNAYLYYISDTFRDNLLKIICFDYQRGKYYLFSSESGCYVQVDMRSSQN